MTNREIHKEPSPPAECPQLDYRRSSLLLMTLEIDRVTVRFFGAFNLLERSKYLRWKIIIFLAEKLLSRSSDFVSNESIGELVFKDQISLSNYTMPC